MSQAHDAWRYDRASGRDHGSRGLVRVLVCALLCAALALTGALAVPHVARASEPTNAGDNLRDGWYPEQGTLTPQLVSGGTFGQLWSATVEGQVYAQPLLADGEVLVATENNKVYALDPATGAQKWATTLAGTAWKAADIGCGDLSPNIGVTATPVVDPATNTAYLTHKAYAAGASGTVRYYMDAINLNTGAERSGFPVQLTGTAQNQPGQSFQPKAELQRPGLLLMNGVVYAAFGSDCDTSPWQGWVFGVSTAGQTKARWVAVASGNGAGIWQSGAGVTSDGPGSLLVSTGNTGSPSVATPGKTPPSSLGESIVRLSVQADGSLKASDFFAPFDAQQLDTWDADFASGGITGLNEQFFGTAGVPHLAVAVGKDGYVYLLNRDELGGFKQGTGGADKVVQRIGPYGGVWSRPGVWPGNGGWVYIPTASAGNSGGGSSGYLRVYQYGVSGTGQPTLSLQASSPDAFGFGTGAPVITSEGTSSGSALVWVEWMPNGTGAGAQLRAYDPVPVDRQAGAPLQRADRNGLEVRHPWHRRGSAVRGHARRQGARVRLARRAGAQRPLDELRDDDDRLEHATHDHADRQQLGEGEQALDEQHAVHARLLRARAPGHARRRADAAAPDHLHPEPERTAGGNPARRNGPRHADASRCRAPASWPRRSSKPRRRCCRSAARPSAGISPAPRPSATSAALRSRSKL